jgi:hypothetical protein
VTEIILFLHNDVYVYMCRSVCVVIWYNAIDIDAPVGICRVYVRDYSKLHMRKVFPRNKFLLLLLFPAGILTKESLTYYSLLRLWFFARNRSTARGEFVFGCSVIRLGYASIYSTLYHERRNTQNSSRVKKKRREKAVPSVTKEGQDFRN